MKMKKILFVLSIAITFHSCKTENTGTAESDWVISVLPPSVRLDPSSNDIIDNRFVALKASTGNYTNMLKENQIFDGEKVFLHGARGEYVSFQLVVTRNIPGTLKNIRVDMPPFRRDGAGIPVKPEFFLEWAVKVNEPSTGYSGSSLGPGWYPDALIPFSCIQDDSALVRWRWIYPLWLPDFNNRIENQRSLIVWVDQYIPADSGAAGPGTWTTSISVSIGEKTVGIPVELRIWDFEIPNENLLKASLQHEGFLKTMPEEQELSLYQLFKRNRIALLDPTYEPGLEIQDNGRITLDWRSFDNRMNKYFSGKAFTREYGYEYGPGYGEPIETFVLPFDVYGKHGTGGWPDIGLPGNERDPGNAAIYIECIKKVREHFKTLIDPDKTDITVYLNGLDESYFPEAWDRMVYYGDMFHKYYPEALYRIDGGYTEEALQIVKNSISSWASHTIEYDYETVRKYQDMGIRVWLYGPMLYESKVNSWVGSSTFIDLPLVNDRAISWSCWKYRTFSWLSWGVGAGWINGWYDPETWKDASKAVSEQDAEFTFKKLNGNALLVYSPGVVPNVNKPCPSIRLKNMRDGVQEYEYMRLLAKVDNSFIRTDSIVNSIIRQPFGPRAIGNIDIWEYDPAQWDLCRIRLGELIEAGIHTSFASLR